jgi:hypothetical protein
MSFTLGLICAGLVVFIIFFIMTWYTSFGDCPHCHGDIVEGVHYNRCINCGRTYKKTER